ncbi:MAG: DNA/RNA non-specific endonuclease [Gemmatimonadaceae bacterium]
MHAPFRSAAVVAFTFVLGACAERGLLTPLAPGAPLLNHGAAMPSVRFSEIHYDNAGTDVGEAIEISGPEGTDVTGWKIYLYNGNGGAVYTPTVTLSGVIPSTCSPRGVIVVNYAVNGLQNGDPDGFALVDNNGVVIEYLSYGGAFTAVGGPAGGALSHDIGVKESSGTPIGLSLKRTGSDVWEAPSTHSFGSCNDDGTPPPTPAVAAVSIAPDGAAVVVGSSAQFTATATDAGGATIPNTSFTWTSLDNAVATVSGAGLATGVTAGSASIVAAAPNGKADTVDVTVTAAPPVGLPNTRFSEIHYDNTGADAGEAIEVEGPGGTSLTGWSIVLYNGNGGASYGTTALSGTISAHASCNGRGTVFVSYPSNGIQNGNPDGFALIDHTGSVVEFLSYGGTFTAIDGPASGRLSSDIGVTEPTSTPIGQSLQRDATGVWSTPSASSFGSCNGTGGGQPPAGSISFTGRTGSDPALPAGFEDQLFATVRDGNGTVISTPVNWTSETPAIATVDANGVVHALAAGIWVVRATTPDGSITGTFSLSSEVAMLGGTAAYGNNTEFGDPFDADPSDDYIIRRDQYASSWNASKGIPNWVSYNLEASHFGASDRCDCFTFDPALPPSMARYTTADYTGAGAIAGYGIDRGHLARSFDRTSGRLDNAYTFLFSNIIPQAADNNQGPWSALEFALGDSAQNNREVYIITGGAGDMGTVKNEGKIVIPTHTWKVAVIMGRDKGLADVQSARDISVMAIVMPNVAGIRNVTWQTYVVTVDSVEALTGYNLLDLLADQIEIAVESRTSPPTAATSGPYSGNEGSSVAMSGAASSDPDGDALTYAWSFGDGATGTGVSTSHTYTQDGSYNVRLVVTDIRGLVDTAYTTVTISNVAPLVNAFAGATLVPGETYAVGGSFTDPGSDPWTATVNYGDGSGVQTLSLSGRTFSLSHVYAASGSYTVTVSITDGLASDSRSTTVTVLSHHDALESALDMLAQLLADGKIGNSVHNPLRGKLRGAQGSLNSGNPHPTITQLDNFQSSLDSYQAGGQIAPADAAPIRALIARVIASLQGS